MVSGQVSCSFAGPWQNDRYIELGIAFNAYLKQCHLYHEKWLNDSSIPVLKLNGNTEFINAIPDDWDMAIKTFIKTNSRKIKFYDDVLYDEYLYTLVTG